jgi:ATP-dependent Clp protease ATP-binding subunit ClpA
MFALSDNLEKKLKALRVRVDTPDSNTLFLRNVPANEDCFNKSRTNLLIKRPHAGQPFIVCVDEDLEYTGSDSALVRAFHAAHRQRGWRAIYFVGATHADSQRLIEDALGVVGFDGHEPVMQYASSTPQMENDEGGQLLASFATDISALVNDAAIEPTVGRDQKVSEVLTAVLQWQPRLALIAGRSGVGKTNLIYAVARQMSQRGLPAHLLAVDLGVLMAGTLFESERESLLSGLLREAALTEPRIVLALEHLELALAGVPRGKWLLAQALDQGLKIIGTLLETSLPDLAPLSRRIQFVELAEVWAEEVEPILLQHRDQIAQHHAVAINDAIVHAVTENFPLLAGTMPATAINVLDIAAAQAAAAGKPEVTLAEIYLSCSFQQATGAPIE